jgi:Zn-dependent protease with chaperone function
MTTVSWLFVLSISGSSLVSAWLGSLVALRGLRPPPVFWVERARRSYPARMATASSLGMLPVLFVVMMFMSGEEFVDSLSGWEIGFAIGGCILGAFMVAWRTARLFRGRTFRFGSWLSGLSMQFLILLPHCCAMFVALVYLPDRFTLPTLELLVPCLLVLSFGVVGGGLLLLRLLGLMGPASPRLATIVAEAAGRTGIEPRAAYELKSIAANAFALPLWHRVIFTDKALQELTDEQLVTICVHELAHLAEPRATTTLRVVSGMFVFLPLIVVRPVIGSFGFSGFSLLVAGALVTFLVARRVARGMEVRADTSAKAHQREEGTYARALERLYEVNLIPAVQWQKRRTHPHLYDRLLAAGVTPTYPRPAPPSRARYYLAVFVTMSVAIVLYGLTFWLLGTE